MKQQFKAYISGFAFRIYRPICLRLERARAIRMYRDGVRQCINMYRDIGSPRVYLFYDSRHRVWAPMTYEHNKKFKPALRRLRAMGKIRGAGALNSVEQMKERSFYYTPSKWGATASDEDKDLQKQKMKTWVAYYLLKLSEPMRKCRQYANKQKGGKTRRTQERA